MNTIFDQRQNALRKILALARMTEANGSTPSEAATAEDLCKHLRHKYDFRPEEIASGTAARGLSTPASSPFQPWNFRPSFRAFYQTPSEGFVWTDTAQLLSDGFFDLLGEEGCTVHIDSIDKEVFTFILTPCGDKEPWHLAGWCRVDSAGLLFKVTVISGELTKQHSFHSVDELITMIRNTLIGAGQLFR